MKEIQIFVFTGFMYTSKIAEIPLIRSEYEAKNLRYISFFLHNHCVCNLTVFMQISWCY